MPFSEVTVQAVTELDNKATHCRGPGMTWTWCFFLIGIGTYCCTGAAPSSGRTLSSLQPFISLHQM
ncbi:hypothetical protein EH540_23465 [Escherichia coli]|nr:hypothetical protein [Escherichia coli]